jgi:hypothetical protein
VAQVVKCLPNKCEAPSSTPVLQKKKKKGGGGMRENNRGGESNQDTL